MARGLILAVRHPRPMASARLCLGRSDVELAAPAAAEAERLLTAIEEPIERIVSSPLRRAFEVAQAVGRLIAVLSHADDRLTEQDFGSWQGRLWASLPRAEVAAWEADPIHVAPGGGESGAALLRRVRHAWTRLASAEETTLVVTHAGPIQCLRHIAVSVKLRDALARSVPYSAVIRLGIT